MLSAAARGGMDEVVLHHRRGDLAYQAQDLLVVACNAYLNLLAELIALALVLLDRLLALELRALAALDLRPDLAGGLVLIALPVPPRGNPVVVATLEMLLRVLLGELRLPAKFGLRALEIGVYVLQVLFGAPEELLVLLQVFVQLGEAVLRLLAIHVAHQRVDHAMPLFV